MHKTHRDIINYGFHWLATQIDVGKFSSLSFLVWLSVFHSRSYLFFLHVNVYGDDFIYRLNKNELKTYERTNKQTNKLSATKMQNYTLWRSAPWHITAQHHTARHDTMWCVCVGHGAHSYGWILHQCLLIIQECTECVRMYNWLLNGERKGSHENVHTRAGYSAKPSSAFGIWFVRVCVGVYV